MMQTTICHHHHSKLGTIFEKRFAKCCNLFKIQKRNVKAGHEISLQLATKFLDHRYECFPGWQLCGTCYDTERKIEKNVRKEMSQTEHESLQINKLDSTTTNYSTNDTDLDEARKQSSELLNKDLQSIGERPIKTQHAKATQRVLCKRKAREKSWLSQMIVCCCFRSGRK